MNDFTEEDLDHYLQNKVDLRHRQVSRMVDEVKDIIQELTLDISSNDARFQPISNSGINNENIKVLSPTYFLISVPLRGLTEYKKHKGRQWRYYTLSGAKLITPIREPEKLHQWLGLENFQKSSREWQEADVIIEGDIVPAKVISIFRELIKNSIKNCKRIDKVSLIETVGPIIRVAVETSELQVEAELVPTIELPSWPKKVRWPRFLKRWPSREKAHCIKSFGFNLMARSNYHWQLSFTRAEHVLLDGLDEDGGCRMKCFRVIRQLKEDIWCPANKPVITSYHLQTLLLWSCEKNPHAKHWRNFKKCFLRLVKKLYKCVSQRFLKHYFVKGHNLLKYANMQELELVAKKLADFLKNPRIYLL